MCCKRCSARNFGVALVVLGVLMLISGIIYHIQFMVGLRHERIKMKEEGSDSCGEPVSTFVDSHDSNSSSHNRHYRNHKHGISHWSIRIRRISDG